MSRFEEAKKIYEQEGIDVEKALDKVKDIPISVHCWQGDDVLGFEGVSSLEGGIQTTGNYPGAAKGPEQLMADIRKCFAYMPGKKRLNLHASYAILGDDLGKVDRDQYAYKHFAPWTEFAKSIGLDGIDFNPTNFAHAKVKDNMTLSSPDEETRRFWIEHNKKCLLIAGEFGRAFNNKCFVNIWIPDGLKDVPGDRLGPRLRLRDALDEILACGYDKEHVEVAVECKLFGIGMESYTTGSSEFYQNYAATRGILSLMDMGHYHPTEVVSDKIPSLLCFYDRLALHVSRPVRWDSDHVIIFDDELKEVAKEIIRNNAEKKVIIGLDYFDASINREIAWVTGERSIQKALLYACLLPNEKLKEYQDKGDFTSLIYLQEHAKMLPFADIYNEYLKRQGMEEDYYTPLKKYEDEVTSKR